MSVNYYQLGANNNEGLTDLILKNADRINPRALLFNTDPAVATIESGLVGYIKSKV